MAQVVAATSSSIEVRGSCAAMTDRPSVCSTRLRGGLCARRRRIRKWLDRSPSCTSCTFDGRHQQRGIRLPNGRWLREQCRARSSCAGCESHDRDTRAARGKGLRADCEGGSLDKPSWYILSTNDHVVSPSLQWAVAKRMDARVTTLQSGHMSLLSHANAVSKIILEAAAHAAGKTAN